MSKRFTYVKNNSISQYSILPIQEIGSKTYHCQGVVDMLNKLNDENEQLKHECNYLQNRLDDFINIQNENEELKQTVADWETQIHTCKHYKNAYANEIVHIKTTIKDMMENERTELGQSVLRQLWEAIQ